MQIHYVDFKINGNNKRCVLPFTLEIDDDELSKYSKTIDREALMFIKLIEKYNEMLGFDEAKAQERAEYLTNNKETTAFTVDEISW